MKARLGYTLATSLALLAGLAGCSPAAQEAGTAPAAEVVRAHAQTEATQSGKTDFAVVVEGTAPTAPTAGCAPSPGRKVPVPDDVQAQRE